MSLTFKPMDQASVGDILEWQYPPPYEMYSLKRGNPEETAACFLDPENGYYAVTEQRGELVAYCCFGPDGRVPGGDYDAAALDIGIGTRPDLTGQGGGHALTKAVLAFGRERYEPTAFRVTVAQFNEVVKHGGGRLALHKQVGYIGALCFD